jgi:hypothetical protein
VVGAKAQQARPGDSKQPLPALRPQHLKFVGRPFYSPARPYVLHVTELAVVSVRDEITADGNGPASRRRTASRPRIRIGSRPTRSPLSRDSESAASSEANAGPKSRGRITAPMNATAPAKLLPFRRSTPPRFSR